MFDTSLTATVQPYTHYVALNATLGSYHITAQRAGFRFTDATVTTEAGATSLVVIHGAR
jgi:hypothetical protein